VEELEAKVKRLRDEENLLKQVLEGAISKEQLENKLRFYKFTGISTVVLAVITIITFMITVIHLHYNHHCHCHCHHCHYNNYQSSS
jgi:hypothetical protein